MPISNLITVPKTVTNVGKFAIELKLTNTGSKTLHVVKDPSGPLFDKLPVNAWLWEGGVTKPPTNEPLVYQAGPAFIGAYVDWDITTYLSTPSPALTKEEIATAAKNPKKVFRPLKPDGKAPTGTLLELKAGEEKNVKYSGG